MHSCTCVPCPHTIPWHHLLFSDALVQLCRLQCVVGSSPHALGAELLPGKAVPNPRPLPVLEPHKHPRVAVVFADFTEETAQFNALFL